MGEEDAEQLRRLQHLLDTQEELHPDLQDYLEEEGPLGCPSIRHPLVYSIFHSPQQNALVNAQYKAKVEGLALAVKDERWGTYIYLHERPYRLDAFLVIEPMLDDQGYWHHLGDIWTDSENIWQNESEWRGCLTDPRPGREHMMKLDERVALEQDYDDTITVYRGFCRTGRHEGLSWTANRTVAKFFARRFAKEQDYPPRLATGEVSKTDVLAYFDGRSEYEMVVLPENVRNIHIKEIPHGTDR